MLHNNSTLTQHPIPTAKRHFCNTRTQDRISLTSTQYLKTYIVLHFAHGNTYTTSQHSHSISFSTSRSNPVILTHKISFPEHLHNIPTHAQHRIPSTVKFTQNINTHTASNSPQHHLIPVTLTLKIPSLDIHTTSRHVHNTSVRTQHLTPWTPTPHFDPLHNISFLWHSHTRSHSLNIHATSQHVNKILVRTQHLNPLH